MNRRFTLAIALCGVLLLASPANAQRVPKPVQVQLYEQAEAWLTQARRIDGKAQRRLQEKAVENLHEALRRAPNYEDAAVSLGGVLRELGRSEEAVTRLQRTLTALPRSWRVQRELGIHLFRLGRYNQGARALEAVISANKATFEVYYLLTSFYYRDNRFERALFCAQKYLKERPKDARVHGVVGNIHLKQGRTSEAIVAFTEVLRLEPSNIVVRVNLGNVFYQLKRYSQAIELFEQVVQKNPDLALVHFNLGSSYYALEKWAPAHASFAAFLELEPENARGHFFCGTSLAKLDRYEPAITHLARATVLDTRDPRAPFAIATLALARKDLITADSFAQTALKRAPDGAAYLHLSGVIARRRKDYARAIENLSAGTRVSPRDAVIRAELGYARILAGSLTEGIDDLEAARTLTPHEERVVAWLPVARTQQAVRQAMAGDLKRAESNLRRALEIAPTLTDAAWNLALLLDVMERTEDGLKVLQTALVHSSKDPNLHLAAAYLLVRLGRINAAQESLKGSVGAADVGMRYLLQGALHGRAGEYQAAAAAFRQAQANGTEPGRALALARLDSAAELIGRGETARAITRLEAMGPRLMPAEARIRAGLMVAALLPHDAQLKAVGEHLAVLEAGPVAAGWGLETLKKDAALLRGYVAYRLGREEEAQKQLSAHLQANPDNLRTRRLLAVVLTDRAEHAHSARAYAKAETLVLRARELAPADAHMAHNQACVLYSRGDHERAAAVFQQQHHTGAIAEAGLNLGLYLDDVKHRQNESMALYREYIQREGIASSIARKRVERKERIFGP